MFGLFFILLAGVGIFWVFGRTQQSTELSPLLVQQLDRLWDIATISMREQKSMRAEKALLTILRFDEKNASAYNRLGILYAKSKQFKEAIECFEIAQSLDSSANGLHNAGLIYFETGNYSKAALAFEQAIAIEGDLPQRYIAYAKAQEKMGNYEKAIEALETAFEIDKSPVTLKYIADIYQQIGDEEKVHETKERILRVVWMRRSMQNKRQKALGIGQTPAKSGVRSTARPTANRQPQTVKTTSSRTDVTKKRIRKPAIKIN